MGEMLLTSTQRAPAVNAPPRLKWRRRTRKHPAPIPPPTSTSLKLLTVRRSTQTHLIMEMNSNRAKTPKQAQDEGPGKDPESHKKIWTG
jgi:hypothetical protein